MLVRLRTPVGMIRAECSDTDDLEVLVDKVLERAGPEADPRSLTFSNQPKGGENKVYGHRGTLKSFGLSHGDLIFVAWESLPASAPASDPERSQQPEHAESSASASTVQNQSQTTEKDAWKNVTEDAIDVYWQRQDGKIPRPKDIKFCRHGDKAMCDYCMPLEVGLFLPA